MTTEPPQVRAHPPEGPADASSDARGALALAGVLAAGLTLGTAHLVAAIAAPGSSPLVAVGGMVVDASPAWLKDAAIAAFGVHDKTALFVVTGLVIAAVAAAIGLVARRRAGLATGLVLALGALGAAAAALRPDASAASVLPAAVGALAGAGALRGLVLRAAPAPTRHPGPGPDRRAFLGLAAVVAAAGVLTAAAGVAVEGLGRAATAARDLVRLPRARTQARAVPAAAQSPVPGVVPFVTPNGEFYRIDTALTVPRVDPQTWRLRVHGLVDREVEIGFDELLASPLVEAHVTLACVSNPVGGDLVGNATWLGLPIREVLGRAGPLPGADMVLSRSVDGFTASTPLEVLLDDRDALLAVGMNGEPLPLAHGFPVRMVVPGLYGFVSATKWLAELEVTRFADQQAYWTVRGWSERGPVKTSSRIEVPADGAALPAGDVAVGGTAWAQHTGIEAVELSVDGGPWEPAELAAQVGLDTWRQWSWTWRDARPGSHELRVRAVDASGVTQTGEVAPVVPDGATGWHTVGVTVTG
ncbi:molybdopterin-dependent oxidoreductase [Cellulomonas sp. APG4]|uniref:molybdopterin-dependent oxidoreductase n=1 Tax=Cellulomonas sp. APG4 TaxID=1538656 RepID=UPI00137B47BE|nr:molybdopterin-dependent oxidoreductase [Cellulomonas sp. APG4]NCT90931.1 molybdopterin-dependent oxidoreductase [Cellulomonas sp. APG4]